MDAQQRQKKGITRSRKGVSVTPNIIMAALEVPTQRARVRARLKDILATADAVALGGRVKPSHDEFF